MKRTMGVAAAFTFFCAPLTGQDKPDVAQLRRDLLAIQQKIAELEKPAEARPRITQIGKSRAAEPATNIAVRIYDLSDLFAIVPAYPAAHAGDLTKQSREMFAIGTGTYAASGGFGGGGLFNMKPGKNGSSVLRKMISESSSSSAVPAGRISIDSLIDVIKQVISPAAWEDGARISKLGNSLVISADNQTHTQIEGLLSAFRKKWGTLRTVSVRADWLWLTEPQLRGLLVARAADKPVYGLVAADAWKKHLEAIAKDAKSHPGFRASLTAYNGQTVHTLSGGQTLAVTDIRPIVLRNDSDQATRVAYRPQVSMIQEGVALQITPTANIAGKTVILDLHSRIARLSDKPVRQVGLPALINTTKTTSPRELVNAIDRKQIAVQRISTTLRIPVNQTMLVGGMSYDHAERPKGTSLYLFVTAFVQEIRNDADNAK